LDADRIERHPEKQLEPRFAALLDYARKLTAQPHGCTPGDVSSLRESGATDEEIHAAVQVTAYFCYINRIASGLGVELEPEHREDDRREPHGRSDDDG
jgi:alkylhydroperoxidase family enzyme